MDPAGLEMSELHFYVLAADRVTVVNARRYTTIEDTLRTVTGVIAEAFAEDGRTGAERRVAWVIEAEVGSADPESLSRVLDQLRDAGYAVLIGESGSFPPPFDPARDRSAAEWQERLGP
jgi:hypothetical protein